MNPLFNRLDPRYLDTRLFKGGNKTPPPRDLVAEGRQTIQAELEAAPQIYAGRQTYDPLYAELETKTLERGLFGTDGNNGQLAIFEQAAPRYQQAISEANTVGRRNDLQDYQELAPGFLTAARNADPENARLLEELTRQAQAELDLNGAASPEEVAASREAVRGAYASRGNLSGSGAITAEMLDRAALRRSRQASARQNAANTSQLRFSQQPNAAAFFSGQGAGSAAALQGQGGVQTNASAAQFDPFNAYAQDLYSSNHNAAWTKYNAKENNRSSMISAGIGALGIIAAPFTGGASLALTAGAAANSANSG
jgi:cell division septum initiation protein DivIVA